MAAKEHVPDQEELALMQRTPAVIAPGHTFESVTDSISSIVLTKRTTIGWFFGFAIAFIARASSTSLLEMPPASWVVRWTRTVP